MNQTQSDHREPPRYCRIYCTPALRTWRYPQDTHLGDVCPDVNVVHGPAFMSRNTGLSHSYSGCRSRKSVARKSAPHGWPARARRLILPAMLLSVALPCTAPPGSFGPHSHSLTPRGDASTWPQSERSLACSFFSKLSAWSARNCSAISTSILPLFCPINCSQRTRRALGEDERSLVSKTGASSASTFGSRAKLELTK